MWNALLSDNRGALNAEMHGCAQIMEWMKDGRYELTEENYMEYIDDITEFLSNYEYNAIFEE